MTGSLEPAVRHVVWDWNGTLLSDTALNVRSVIAGLAAIGKPRDLTVDQFRRLATRPLRSIYTDLLGTPLGQDEWDTVEAVWLATYVDGLVDAALSDGAVAALDEVAARGWTQSIVSLHVEAELVAHVAALGLTGRFTHVSGSLGSWGSTRKSKADEVRGQLAGLGLEPEQALMIGDMIDDGLQARAAGTAVVLVPTGDTSRERLLASGFPVADSLLSAIRGELVTS